MDTLIIPLVKDKKEDIGSSDSYRPISLTTVVSKVFESVILDNTNHCYKVPQHNLVLNPDMGQN